MFIWHAQWGRIEQEEVIKGGQKRPFLGPTRRLKNIKNAKMQEGSWTKLWTEIKEWD